MYGMVDVNNRYRDVQCMWTKCIVDLSSSSSSSNPHNPLDNSIPSSNEDKAVEVPIVLLYSENRNYLEGYRVPSFSRVLNTYFPHPYLLISCHSYLIPSCRFALSPMLGEFILYDQSSSSHCDRIVLHSSLFHMQNPSQLVHQRDVHCKGMVIQLLKRIALLDHQSDEQCTLMGRILY